MAIGVGDGGGVVGTHSQSSLLMLGSHCPATTRTSGPLQSFPGGHGNGGNDTTHGPLQLSPLHSGVGVAAGVEPTGTHAQPLVALDSHCPSCTRSGHGTFGGQESAMVHGPPHAPVHWGVGVAVGVGLTGTHAHSADAVISHCPDNTGTFAPLHTPGRGHGNGGNDMVHGPLQASVHGGVGVGIGVGPIGTHSQVLLDVGSHCPNRTGPSGHGGPPTHGNEIVQSPPHGAVLHWGVGVANGVGTTGTHSQSLEVLISHCPS